MTTSHQPSLRLSTSSGPPSFLKQLLDEINGTGPPTVSCNSQPLQTSFRVRLNRYKERCVPSVKIGGGVVAQDLHERLQEPDEACLKNMDTFSEDHHGLDRIALPRPRPNLSRLKTQLPAPSRDEVAQSSSVLTCSESGLSSTSSRGEAPSSALTASSTNATMALSHLGSGNNSPRKREQGLDDTELQHISKKIRSMPSLDVEELLVTANGAPRLTMDFQGLGSGNMMRDKAVPESTMARGFMRMPDEYQRFESPSPGYSATIDDAASTKALRPATPQRESRGQRTPTIPDPPKIPETPETPETPSFARSLHLFDASVFMHKDGRGDNYMQDISIYKSTHGDEWAENSLCEHCFHQYGLLSRILAYGYESCGREERLKDYYWKPAIGPSC